MNRVPKSKSVGFYHVMEAFSTTTNYPSHVETYRPASPQRASTPPKRTSEGHTSPRNVSFGRNNNRDEEKEKRQKYLTARYGQHQMMLIRKRLAVEDWLYDKLRNMYTCVVSKHFFSLSSVHVLKYQGFFFFFFFFFFLSGLVMRKDIVLVDYQIIIYVSI